MTVARQSRRNDSSSSSLDARSRNPDDLSEELATENPSLDLTQIKDSQPRAVIAWKNLLIPTIPAKPSGRRGIR